MFSTFLCLSLSLFAVFGNPNTVQPVVMGWNINTDRRVDAAEINDPRYEHTIHAFGSIFGFENRLGIIDRLFSHVIDKEQVNLFAMQELSENSAALLQTLLQNHGFNSIITKVNKDHESFIHLIGYNPEIYEIEDVRRFYLTLSGEHELGLDYLWQFEGTDEEKRALKKKIFNNNLDNAFTRSSQLVKVKLKDTQEVFVLVNNHFGLENKHKILASILVSKKVNEYLDETNSPKMPVVMVGDINAFDKKSNSDALLTEMFEHFEEEGFDWMTRGFENHKLGGSFVAFPFDIKRFFKQEDFLKLDSIKIDGSVFEIYDFYLETRTKRNATYASTMLDHVFTKNLNPAFIQVRQLLMIVGNIDNVNAASDLFVTDPTEMPTRKELEKMVYNNYKQHHLFTPSDHIPYIIKLNQLLPYENNLCRINAIQ